MCDWINDALQKYRNEVEKDINYKYELLDYIIPQIYDHIFETKDTKIADRLNYAKISPERIMQAVRTRQALNLPVCGQGEGFSLEYGLLGEKFIDYGDSKGHKFDEFLYDCCGNNKLSIEKLINLCQECKIPLSYPCRLVIDTNDTFDIGIVEAYKECIYERCNEFINYYLDPKQYNNHEVIIINLFEVIEKGIITERGFEKTENEIINEREDDL